MSSLPPATLVPIEKGKGGFRLAGTGPVEAVAALDTESQGLVFGVGLCNVYRANVEECQVSLSTAVLVVSLVFTMSR